MSEQAISERLVAYLAARDRERTDRAEAKWRALNARERDLVREAAVMGFVHGNMNGGQQVPRDSEVVRTVLLACEDHADLYPTIAALANQETP